MTPDKMTGSDFAIAAGVNVLLYRTVAVSLKAPGWIGGVAAAIAMAIAVDPTVPQGSRQIAGALSAPGALAIKLFKGKAFRELVNSEKCDCPGGEKNAPCRC
jgi:hypothetical protein